MKNFLTSLLGSLAALFLFSIGAFLLFIGIIGAIVSAGVRRAQPAEARIENGAYLVYDLSTDVTDAPPAYDFDGLGSPDGQPLQLHTVVRAIHEAARDDRVAGIVLIGSFNPVGVGAGYGALQELRGAIASFKASGKPVKAYLEYASTKDYYVASVANEINLDPYGMIYMPGLFVQPYFLSGTFEKYGIDFQYTRVGKYKNYVETFTRQDMSPESREETQRLIDDIWGSVVRGIGAARKLSRAQIQAVVDSQGLIRADAAKAARLVDRVAYRDQVIEGLRKETGPALGTHTFKQVSLANYAKQLRPEFGTGSGSVAVVYAEGDIVDGEGTHNDIGGVRFAREIRKLRQDDNVKAIVLRVDSPGGSASAAENIQRELWLARQTKPVIVSMGSYAASGGYWISAYGNHIFAEPTTITGSIGVFGMFFSFEKLAGSVGVTFDQVKTGKYAGLMSTVRAKSPEQMAVFQNMVDWIYGEFVSKVADGRRLPKATVEEIAQGRVWSGLEAQRLHLVDEIGGLESAIRYAGRAAGLGPNPRIIEYPGKRSFAEALAELFGRTIPETDKAQSGLIGDIERTAEQQLATLRSFNDPAGVYARLPLGLDVR
jgi:protease-4